MTRMGAPAIAAALLWATALAAQTPTFSARVEAVRLDVLVTDNGRPVRGLTAADFEVLDNGVRQAIDFVSFEQIPLNVVLLLDASSSVIGERLDHLRDASQALLDSLKKDDHAALLTFNEAVAQDAALTLDTTRLAAVLEGIEPTGDTALTDGAYVAMNVADASSGRSLLMIFSDGLDTASWLAEDAVIDAGRRAEVVVYAVATGAKHPRFLRELTSATGGRLYALESTRDLRAVFLSALEEFRQRYLLSYMPAGVAKGGWHKVEVRVKGRRVTVKARPGYLAAP